MMENQEKAFLRYLIGELHPRIFLLGCWGLPRGWGQRSRISIWGSLGPKGNPILPGKLIRSNQGILFVVQLYHIVSDSRLKQAILVDKILKFSDDNPDLADGLGSC